MKQSNVTTEVDALLESEQLSKSRAMSELLKYLCDRYPNKANDPTSEYSIAQDLLGRGADFDPKNDPVVRVRIRRLRAALNLYYRDRTEGVRLTIPGRSYDLALVECAVINDITKPRLNLLVVGAMCSMALAIGILSWTRGGIQHTGYPLVEVLPILNMTGDPDKNIFEAGLQRQIASDLMRFGQLRVILAVPGEQSSKTPDFELRGSIIKLEDDIDLAFSLEMGDGTGAMYDARVRGKIFGQDYYEGIAKISSEISGKIASQGGPLSTPTAQNDLLKAGHLSFGGVKPDTFECILLQEAFLADYDPERFLRAYRCFEQVLTRVGDDPVALSDWGTLLLHAVPEFGLMQTDRLPSNVLYEPDVVLNMARIVAERFPRSSEALLFLGAVQTAMGQFTQAGISLQHALRLNPGDATIHSVLSYLELARGEFNSAIDAANAAVRLSANPQGYIFLPVFIAALALGDDRAAIEAGETYAKLRTGDSSIVARLIVAQLRDEGETVQKLLPVVEEMPDPVASFGIGKQSKIPQEVLADQLP